MFAAAAGVGASRVYVCHVERIARPRELVSSTDGVFAMELHRPADERAEWRWRIVGRHELELGPGWALDLARRAWQQLAEPSVGAIVVDGGLSLDRYSVDVDTGAESSRAGLDVFVCRDGTWRRARGAGPLVVLHPKRSLTR